MTHDHHEHDHDHHAGHDHGHSHAPTSFGRAFAIGVTLNLVIVAAELVFGYLANSLSLISDAAHNFTDVVGLLLAWGGAWLAARQPTAALHLRLPPGVHPCCSRQRGIAVDRDRRNPDRGRFTGFKIRSRSRPAP